MEGRDRRFKSCIPDYDDDLHWPRLIRGKDYEVLGEEHGMYRVVDEDGEDFLYPKDWFR